MKLELTDFVIVVAAVGTLATAYAQNQQEEQAPRPPAAAATPSEAKPVPTPAPVADPTDAGRKEVERSESPYTGATIIKLENKGEQTYHKPRTGSLNQMTVRAEETDERGRTLRYFMALIGQLPKLGDKVFGELTLYFDKGKKEVVTGYFVLEKALDVPADEDIITRTVFEFEKKTVLVDRRDQLPKK